MESKKIENILKQNNSYSKGLSIAGILLVVLGMLFYVTMNNQLKQENKVIADSLNTIHTKISKDTLKIIEHFSKKRDSVMKILDKYFANKVKSDQEYRFFYMDTLKRFFLKEMIPLNEILQKKLYKSPRNTERSIFLYSREKDVDIDLNYKDTIQIYVNLVYYFDSLKAPHNIIYQLKMNSNYKIFYVRNLLPQAPK